SATAKESASAIQRIYYPPGEPVGTSSSGSSRAAASFTPKSPVAPRMAQTIATLPAVASTSSTVATSLSANQGTLDSSTPVVSTATAGSPVLRTPWTMPVSKASTRPRSSALISLGRERTSTTRSSFWPSPLERDSTTSRERQ